MEGFVIALICAVVDWWAVANSRRRVEYIFKPATLIAILIAAGLLTRGPHDARQALFFLIGLGLSLIGDILLMLRQERLFLAGLAAFLMAHVCYIVGLTPTLPPAPAIALLIPVAVIGIALYRPIAAKLRQRDKRRLLVPVALYSIVLSLMLFSAWATLFRPTWTAGRRGLVVLGASLFFASDVMLAWDRFVTPSPSARLWVHVTYHLGQIALTASIALLQV